MYKGKERVRFQIPFNKVVPTKKVENLKPLKTSRYIRSSDSKKKEAKDPIHYNSCDAMNLSPERLVFLFKKIRAACSQHMLMQWQTRNECNTINS